MTAFHFSLEKVRSYKSSLEQQLKLQLAAVRHSQQEEETCLESYRQVRAGCPAILGAVVAGDLLQEAAFLEALDNSIVTQQERVARARLAVREKCNQVQLTMQERKVLDRLHDRQLSSYRYELGREEQKQIDELAGNRCQGRPGE